MDPVESSVQELLHSMIKSFMDSVVSINVRIDGVVKDVAHLKASLEFSQNIGSPSSIYEQIFALLRDSSDLHIYTDLYGGNDDCFCNL